MPLSPPPSRRVPPGPLLSSPSSSPAGGPASGSGPGRAPDRRTDRGALRVLRSSGTGPGRPGPGRTAPRGGDGGEEGGGERGEGREGGGGGEGGREGGRDPFRPSRFAPKPTGRDLVPPGGGGSVIRSERPTSRGLDGSIFDLRADSRIRGFEDGWKISSGGAHFQSRTRSSPT